MRTSHHLASLPWLLLVLALTAIPALAQEGDPILPGAALSDQKAGSVLVYNLYSSSATSAATTNTRISVTNTSPISPVAVHLFFIEGASCSPADIVVCLTQSQTAIFSAADIDPGTEGFVVAVAVDRMRGCPISFNHLIGAAYIKLSSGHATSLGAEAIAALYGSDGVFAPGCNPGDAEARLNFNGLMSGYNQLPLALALSSIPSVLDGNSTLLVINSLSGNLLTAMTPLGSLFGILFSDTEATHSFSIRSSQCQIKEVLSNNWPRTTPRLNTVIPAGRTGWLKLYATSGRPLSGAVINFNPFTSLLPSAFSHGHNLHKLTLVPSSSLLVPVFPSNCF